MAACAMQLSDSSYEVIQPASKKELAPVVKWVKRNKEKIDIYNPDFFDSFDGYLVDINNDGKKEYVFLEYKGTGQYLSIYIFAKDSTGIRQLELPKQINEALDEAFYNPFTKQCELFVRAQGKIYICLSDYTRKVRSIYLWEHRKAYFCCDEFWINEQRKLFNALYKEKRYAQGYKLLYRFEAQCRYKIDPQIDLWLRNDLALAALLNDGPHTSQKIINELKGEKDFSYASPSLIEAVQQNEELCRRVLEEEKKNGLRGVYDYAWLLEYKDQSNNGLAHDNRIHRLLSAIIPDIDNARLNREEVWQHLVGPGELGIQITGERYVTFNGFYCHAAFLRGFVWCDIKEGIGVVATGEAQSNMFNNSIYPLFVASRNLTFEELPQEFFTALKQWVQVGKIAVSQATFYDRFGKETSLDFVQN